MSLFETREELLKAVDEAEARLRKKYKLATFNTLVDACHARILLAERRTGDCPMHLAFAVAQEAKDMHMQEAFDLALMVVKRLEKNPESSKKGMNIKEVST